jgi:membrane-associated protein
MQEFLINLSTHHAVWIYLVVICTAWLGGPVYSMLFGVLIKLGYFSFTPAYIALMLGELLGDTVWYSLGYFWGHGVVKKLGKYVSISEKRIDEVVHLFHKYHSKILIISKITNGFGFSFVTLVTAGISKMSFTKFISLNMIGQFIWSGLLIAIGYYFSHAYLQINDILGKISLVILFIALVAGFLGFINYLRTRVEKL